MSPQVDFVFPDSGPELETVDDVVDTACILAQCVINVQRGRCALAIATCNFNTLTERLERNSTYPDVLYDASLGLEGIRQVVSQGLPQHEFAKRMESGPVLAETVQTLCGKWFPRNVEELGLPGGFLKGQVVDVPSLTRNLHKKADMLKQWNFAPGSEISESEIMNPNHPLCG